MALKPSYRVWAGSPGREMRTPHPGWGPSFKVAIIREDVLLQLAGSKDYKIPPTWLQKYFQNAF